MKPYTDYITMTENIENICFYIMQTTKDKILMNISMTLYSTMSAKFYDLDFVGIQQMVISIEDSIKLDMK